MHYAGIGSRQTPQDILQRMYGIAKLLETKGFILRSGGAVGADTAFEKGVKGRGNKTIYKARDATPEAIASKYHPAWNRCNNYVKQLMGRNMMIVLGKDLKTPVSFIVCWTIDGRPIGGTGQALRLANDFKITIYNLGHKLSLDRLTNEWF